MVNHYAIDENFEFIERWRHFADIKNKNLKYGGKSVLKILLKLLVNVLLKVLPNYHETILQLPANFTKNSCITFQ